MKVCMIAQHSVTLVGGGPRVQALETARHLAGCGVEVEFFDPWRQYDRGAFDLAHIFGANMMTYDIALRLHQFERPFVVSSIFYTMRSPAFMRAARRVESFANRLFSGVWTDYGLTARVCSMAEAVLPNTADEGRLIAEGMEIDARKIAVVPNGVDERFRDADPALFTKRYGLRDFILCVGHIGSRRKNVLALIRALARIDHPAVIIGQVQHGDYARQCMEEAARNRNITIIEGLPNNSPMLESAYAACDVFTLPSTFETPGIAALEAGLAGAKIAITKYGGTREYFLDDAEYQEPSSVASIASAIERALARPKDDALRERIHREYLWRRVAEKTAALYRSLPL
jgi:glycosyltransferase involved in cell wall biosynthesis